MCQFQALRFWRVHREFHRFNLHRRTVDVKLELGGCCCLALDDNGDVRPHGRVIGFKVEDLGFRVEGLELEGVEFTGRSLVTSTRTQIGA